MSREATQGDVTFDLVNNHAVPSFEEKRSDTDSTGFMRDRPIGQHSAPGLWQTKSQFVFDVQEKSLIRRTYTAWNSFPLRDLDFTWTPNAVASDAPGRIEGTGRLIWRPKGKPAYDRGSIYAEYNGEMKDGKPNGRGAYFDESGVCYEGEWSEGHFEGSGRLQLPNGDEYIGTFHAGNADGEGSYFRADGEVYAGEFRDGLRSGTATLSLPNGGSYQSQWLAGQEIPESRRVRLAQLGPYLAAPDDVRIGIVVDRLPIKNGMLGYAASNTEDGLLIRPANKRLMNLWKGSEEIQLTDKDLDPDRGGIFAIDRAGKFNWSDSGLPPVLLVLDVENRGSNSIQVVDAYLDVAESSIDLQPMVVITTEICTGSYYNSQFVLENFGWGPLEQASLRLSFTNPKQSAVLGAQAWSKDLGLIHEAATVDVEENLRAAGVDVAELQRRGNTSFSCKSKSQSECFSKILRSGMFGRLASDITHDDFFIQVNVAGLLAYKWKDSEGRMHDRESPLNVQMDIGTLVNAAECEGGEIDPLHTNIPLMLKLERTQYKLPIDFRSSIAPGRVERYSLPVRAPKSSHHNYRVVLALADGREIKSRPIDLLYFVPNPWDRKVDQ
jgi:hypothetical protein